MANLRIVPYNDHDDATLTTSAAPATGYAVTETQNSTRGRTWRTTSNAGQSISGTLAASRTVSSFFMFLHTAHGGNVRLQLYSDAAWVTQVYDSTAVAAIPYTTDEAYVWSKGSADPFKTESPYWLYFTAIACQSYIITFSATPTATYWSASRLFLGKYFEAAVNPDYGLQLGYADITDRNRTQGGSLRTNVGAIWRTLSMDLNGINENERGTWMQIMRQAGTGRDVVASAFPGDGTSRERDHTINGKLVSLDALGRQVSRLTKRVQLEEV